MLIATQVKIPQSRLNWDQHGIVACAHADLIPTFSFGAPKRNPKAQKNDRL